MATKVTSGLISADAALVDLNIDANTLYVDASANRVGIGKTDPASAFHVKGDEVQIEDPSGGYKLHLNADANPVVITANDNTGANYSGFSLKTNNGGGSPVTAMNIYPHSSTHVGFGTDARTDTKMVISKTPTSATQTTPETILTLSTPCVTTASDIKVGQGPRLVFEIPDDQSGNKATGAAIAGLKEIDDDTNSQTSLAFYTSDDDETLDQRMTILSDGKVGIGTTSPDAKLQIMNNDGSSYRFGYGGSSDVYLDADNVYFRTDNGGANTAVFTTTGLGIGTTSPATNLHIDGVSNYNGVEIKGSGGSRPMLQFSNANNGDLGAIYGTEGNDLVICSGSGNAVRMTINDTGNVYFSDPSSGNYVASFTGQSKANAINVGPYATFGTDYSGWGANLGWNVRPKIGTTSSGFEAATGYYNSGASMIRCSGMTIGMTLWTASEIAQSNIGSGTTMFNMASNGVMSGDFNDTSDVALKENISTIANGLDIIGQLNPVTFDWKNASKGNGRGGFIAQEVETVLPNDVDGDNYTGTPEEDSDLVLMGKSINTSSIVAHLVKAVQELKAENDSLKGRIETLEG